MMPEPSQPPRKGRPRIDENGPGTQVTVRLSGATYDAVYALASEQGIDVAALIREAIQQRLLRDRRGQTRPF